jgi:hypothetical protein
MIGKVLAISLLVVSIWLVSPLIQFGAIDPMALVVGIVAIWFVWRETRRSNTAIVKVTECEGSCCRSVYENNCQFFQRLRVKVQNQGISLWNMGIAIRFQLDGGGNMTFHLSRHFDEESPEPVEPTGPVEFARGMIAEYSSKSYKFTPRGGAEGLLRLKDARKQKAEICVFSQCNLACTIRVGGRWERLKACWNRLAYRINTRFDKTVERPNGPCPLLIPGKILPTFFVLEYGLANFIRGLREEFDHQV